MVVSPFALITCKTVENMIKNSSIKTDLRNILQFFWRGEGIVYSLLYARIKIFCQNCACSFELFIYDLNICLVSNEGEYR